MVEANNENTTKRSPLATAAGVALFIIIVAGALALRFTMLDKSMWVDESTSYSIATQPTVAKVVKLASFRYTAHPPLYYVLVHLWFKSNGAGLLQMRMLSCLFGVMWVLITYPVAMLLFRNRPAALAAMALTAFSPFAVYISQIGRMYSLLALLTLVSSWFFLKLALDGKRSIFLWAGWIASSAALLYTQYYGANVIIFHTVCALLWRKRLGRPFMIRCFIALAAAGAAFLPWFGTFMNQSKTVSHLMNSIFAGAISKLQYLLIVAGAGAVFSGVPVVTLSKEQFTALFVFSTIAFLMCAVRLFLNRRAVRESAQFLFLYLAVPISMMFISAAFVRGIAFQWHFSYLSPAAYLIGGFALSRHGAKIFRAVLFILITVLYATGLTFHARAPFWDHDWRGAAKHIIANSPPATPVLSLMPMDDYPLKEYYLAKTKHTVTSMFSQSASRDLGFSPMIAITQSSYKNDCFWIVATGEAFNKDVDPQWLEIHFTVESERTFPAAFTQPPLNLMLLCLAENDKPLRKMQQRHYDEIMSTSWQRQTPLEQHFSRADFFFTRGYTALAEQEMRTAAKQSGPLPEISVNLGFILRAQNNITAALDEWKKALAKRPGDKTLSYLIGETLYAESRLAEAAPYLKTSSAGNDENAQKAKEMLNEIKKSSGKAE